MRRERFIQRAQEPGFSLAEIRDLLSDDHNPPRVAARNLFDLAIGHDNLFHGDRYRWSAQFQIINLTDANVLYNFLSTFSGTHYVTPRAFTGTVAFHF